MQRQGGTGGIQQEQCARGMAAPRRPAGCTSRDAAQDPATARVQTRSRAVGEGRGVSEASTLLLGEQRPQPHVGDAELSTDE